ncbi:hypothetical protein KQX54_007467 [Cotesia glomerata]|uniref:Uncharacterized protein n=1 Tax=Cotesia glomerata TaxID=32391 RepID=A0AAV7IJ81_COTGL|nr:hypothetical protein KQX54_007467 [Cotesia glomerata]
MQVDQHCLELEHDLGIAGGKSEFYPELSREGTFRVSSESDGKMLLIWPGFRCFDSPDADPPLGSFFIVLPRVL